MSMAAHDFLTREVERVASDYSLAGEGKSDRVLDPGVALVRADPVNGLILRLAFAPAGVEPRLDAVITPVLRHHWQAPRIAGTLKRGVIHGYPPQAAPRRCHHVHPAVDPDARARAGGW